MSINHHALTHAFCPCCEHVVLAQDLQHARAGQAREVGKACSSENQDWADLVLDIIPAILPGGPPVCNRPGCTCRLVKLHYRYLKEDGENKNRHGVKRE